MNENYCQCCGMPMGNTDEMYGLEADGTKSKDYCKYCYNEGKMLFNGTMEDMINFCIPHMISANPSLTEENARNFMQKTLPMLKYWKK